jgi:hypothetical protein
MVKTVVQEALSGLIDDLRATHRRDLASVVLYGSAAAGDHVELRSDYNLLIALNRITPEDLRLAQGADARMAEVGPPATVYFTVEELSDAGDVFPIEFHQMANARVVLFGKDPFEFVKLSDLNLRHQTEYELRSKVIQLRRLYIPASVSVERLCDLMRDSWRALRHCFVPSFCYTDKRPPLQNPIAFVRLSDYWTLILFHLKESLDFAPAVVCRDQKRKRTNCSETTCSRLNEW